MLNSAANRFKKRLLITLCLCPSIMAMMSYQTPSITLSEGATIPKEVPLTVYAVEEYTILETAAPVIEPISSIDLATVYDRDLRTRSLLSAEQLQLGLQKGLTDKASLIVQYGNTYNIDCTFIAAVAAQESGWGTSLWVKKYNNYFGYANKRRYNSFEESLKDFCEGVANNYLADTGIYHTGYTVTDTNIFYCEQSEWTESISNLMVQIHNRSIETN